MLTDIGHKNSFMEFRIECFKDHLRCHPGIPAHRKRFFLFPLSDPLSPCGCVFFFRPFDQFFECAVRVGYDRHVYNHISRNRRRIDVNVDDLCLRRKFVQIAGNTVVKTGSYGKEHVTFADRFVGSVFSVHAAVSDIERMIGRQGAFSHDRRNDRDLHFFRECS